MSFFGRTPESERKRIKAMRKRIDNGEDAKLKDRWSTKVKITYNEDGDMEVWDAKTRKLVGYNLDDWQFSELPKSMKK